MDEKANPRFIISVLSLCLLVSNHASLGADTISSNQPLSGDKTIVSAGGAFVLGFFSPVKSSNFYIGMWYRQVAEKTVVWVANREKPVLDRFSSELRILDGNLVLFNESKFPVWSTDVNSSFRSVEAVLLDNGNLVLQGRSNTSKKPLWESFDHPADTWLPDAKFGYNKRTNKMQMLTSWKSKEDPAPGLFSLEPVLNSSSYIIRRNRSKIYWNSGSWNGHIFSGVPEMKLNYIYNFNFVSNDEESYFTYSVFFPSFRISKFVMDISGQITQQNYLDHKGWILFWSQPRQACQVYAFCGPYGTCNEKSLPLCNCLKGFQPKSQSDWDTKEYFGGCLRKEKLHCGNGKRDKFQELPSTLLSDNDKSVVAHSVTSCELVCLNDCSCTAYSYSDNNCSIWTGDLLNIQHLEASENRGKTLHIRLAASEFPNPKNKKVLVICIVVGSSAGSIALLGLVLILIWRRQKKITEGRKAMEGSLMVFGYKDLQNATTNFSEKLGGGGFGSVFKGVLPDSTIIAVKKLESFGQGEKQFRTEVNTIGTIQHVNLVRLRGFCSHATNRLLVYDYMPNGSLDTHLFVENRSNVLDWDTRYHIALGTARGLVYLHEKCRDCIIHCDIKPENILLDAEFCPKVADFGLAKLVGREFSRVLTTMRGTRGYLAPEWIAGVAITPKADAYSYGMMLFELVSGRRNTVQSEDGKVNFFPTMASNILAEGGNPISLLDPSLEGNADVEELERISKVAFWCIQDDEFHRPTMSQVVQILEGIVDVNLPHFPRSLQVYVENNETIMFFTESSSQQRSSAHSITSSNSSAKQS